MALETEHKAVDKLKEAECGFEEKCPRTKLANFKLWKGKSRGFRYGSTFEKGDISEKMLNKRMIVIL